MALEEEQKESKAAGQDDKQYEGTHYHQHERFPLGHTWQQLSRGHKGPEKKK